MRAVVIYESMYGNTHVVASNIADGLRATHEATLVPVAEATGELVAAADLLVVGESSRARRWGEALGAAATIAYVPARA